MTKYLKVSNTKWLSSDLNELYDRINLLLQEKEVGSNCIINNHEIVAVADKLLENKCISTRQHRFLLLNCLK